MYNRRNKALKFAFLGLVLGLVYAIICKLGFGIPCMFHLITGLKCPGCGISRMCLALLDFNIKSAFYYNAGILLASPVLIFIIVRCFVNYIKLGHYHNIKSVNILSIILIIHLLLFAIIRNLNIFNIY